MAGSLPERPDDEDNEANQSPRKPDLGIDESLQLFTDDLLAIDVLRNIFLKQIYATPINNASVEASFLTPTAQPAEDGTTLWGAALTQKVLASGVTVGGAPLLFTIAHPSIPIAYLQDGTNKLVAGQPHPIVEYVLNATDEHRPMEASMEADRQLSIWYEAMIRLFTPTGESGQRPEPTPPIQSWPVYDSGPITNDMQN